MPAEKTPAFTVTHPHRNIHVVKFAPRPKLKTGDEVGRIFLRSDAHHDSRRANRTLEMEQLERARGTEALIFDNGDVFDVMQSRNDPRRGHGSKREGHDVPNYIDEVIEEAASDYAPFAPWWIVMGRGNHETAVQKQLGTDLTERLVHHMRLASPEKTSLHSGGYSGYVRFRFQCGGVRRSKLMHYYHGTGGSAPVTRGAIQTQRRSRAHPDADIIWTGHTHNSLLMPWPRWRMGDQDNLRKDIQFHIVTPGYKDDMGDGFDGFGVERLGNEPKENGGAWVKFIWSRKLKDIIVKPELDIEAAE